MNRGPDRSPGRAPVHSSTSRRRWIAWVSSAALALTVAACGAQAPQAPPAYATKLGAATRGISTACGETYRLTAFDGTDRARLVALEAAASSSVDGLALVDRRDPDWIYLGQTVRQIVADSAALLRSCGLHRARARLLRRARSR